MPKCKEHIKAEMSHVDRSIARTKARICPKNELCVRAMLHDDSAYLISVRLEAIWQLHEDELCIPLLDLRDSIIKLQVIRLVLDR